MSKYALLVGINKYRAPGNDLSGCLNDVNDMLDILTMRGWDYRNFLVLQDAFATRDGIIDGLHWLFAKPQPDEPAELLFHYSGHGSQVRTSDPNETDHLTEIICPYDYDEHWGDPLSDDALRDTFKLKPSMACLTVVLDCCHSGHGTRNGAPIGQRRTPKYIKAPETLGNTSADLPVNRLGVRQDPGYRTTSAAMNHLLLAACQSSQTAADAMFGGRANGAMTWALLRAMRVMDVHAKAHDVFNRATLMVREENFEQKPAIEGRKYLRERMFLGGV